MKWLTVLLVVVLLAACSTASAQDYYSNDSGYWSGCHYPPGDRYCRTYLVPVANLYRAIPNCRGGYGRGEYIETRYEIRTYCSPVPDRLRQPTNRILWSR